MMNNTAILILSSGTFGTLLGWLLKCIADHWSETRAFDHRIRLEKEYGLYVDLWDNLFELRLAIGSLTTRLGADRKEYSLEDSCDLFNTYKSIVRKGEPFMSASVFRPAREIETIAREIHSNIQDISQEQQRSEKQGSENDAGMCISLNKENKEAFEKIDHLFHDVAQAIRCRVTP